jgi:hypothetical protein
MIIEQQEVVAREALADAMLAAVDAGASDQIVGNEVIKLALTIIQQAQGGRRDLVPAVLRTLADHIEANPEAPVTIN